MKPKIFSCGEGGGLICGSARDLQPAAILRDKEANRKKLCTAKWTAHLGRRRFIDHMRKHPYLAVFHYQPLPQSEMGKRWGLKGRELPETDRVAGRLVRLPFYTSMTESEQDQVLEAVQKFIV
jgi:dTDP-4-amino-4,6-dideoxygalactose transaminase